MNTRALVVCVGNDLVGDDGAGGAVHAALEATLPEGAELVRLGLGGLALLELLDGQDVLVVVDAVHLDAPVGTVRVFEGDDLPRALQPAVSAHGIGLAEALAVGRALSGARMPGRVAMVTIEGRRFDRLGEGLSPEVAAAVPEAAATVRALVSRAAAEGER